MFTISLVCLFLPITLAICSPSAILMQGMVSALTDAPLRSVEFTRVTNAFGFVVGVTLVLFSMLRVGIIANLLSWPVMSGFTTGAAITIIASQLQPFFGLKLPREDNTLLKLYQTLKNLPSTRWQVVLIASICLVAIYYAKRVAIRGWRLPAKTPVALIVVLIAVGVSYAGHFEAAGIPVVGDIPTNLPTPGLPPLTDAAEFVQMLPSAVLLGIINYVQTVSVELVLARKVGEVINPTTELLALGTSGVVGSFFSAHAICGGFTRSAVQHQAGAKTPLTILFTAVMMLLCTVAVSPLFHHLPNATLAAMIIAAAVQLINISEMRTMWRNAKGDVSQALVTIAFVVGLGLEKGIMAGVALSMLLIVYRALTPRITALGRLPHTQVWVATYRYPQVGKTRRNGRAQGVVLMTCELVFVCACACVCVCWEGVLCPTPQSVPCESWRQRTWAGV